ncbi:MAG TPA: TIGR03668 family PPOX class F420-dependent oxidoreductase [Roseiflexaceae bacterium]|nr:TIGR03668 family PPOX class F420-dependent oxidoreductase [Roseiflexaceae bacterium]
MIDVQHIPPDQPLRIIIGAGQQAYPGWIATQKEQLDLLRRDDWSASFSARPIDALLCEHVWEHLTEQQGREAARICYDYLKPGGYLRCAVPDANFPDPEYQRTVQIGGRGPRDHPAADHQVVYDHQRFADVFTSAGFEVDLLEYCDAYGRFHYNQWDPESGVIYRSLRFDHRNQHGKLGSVSLILDARKPAASGRPATLAFTPQQLAFLHAQRAGRLATATRDGAPHVIPVCYACDGASLYIALDTKPKRVPPERLRRIRNILENPRVALVIDHYSDDWSQLAYLLIRGTAALIRPGESEHRRAIALLRERYPQYQTMPIEQQPAIAIRPAAVVEWRGAD